MLFVIALMMVTIGVLLYTGTQIVIKSKKTSYRPGTYLGIGLLLPAFSFSMYIIRDVLVQDGLYDVQFIFYRVGAVAQAVAGFFILLFVLKGFTSERVQRIGVPGVALLISGIIFSFLIFPVRSLVQNSPLLGEAYITITHPWESMIVNIGYLLAVVFLVGVVVVVFVKNMKTLDSKEGKIKALMYAGGIATLFLSVIPSVLISALFARVGYFIGALILYRAFFKKTTELQDPQFEDDL